MKKVAIFCILINCACTNAQTFLLSQSAELLIPQGTFKSSAGTGFGTSVKFERRIYKAINATVSIGFCTFRRKTYKAPTQPLSSLTVKTEMVPVQLGMSIFPFANNPKSPAMYIAAETGFHVITGKLTLNGQDVSPRSESDFSYAFAIGLRKRRSDLSYKQQVIAKHGQQSVYGAIRFAWQLCGKVK